MPPTTRSSSSGPSRRELNRRSLGAEQVGHLGVGVDERFAVDVDLDPVEPAGESKRPR